MLNGHVVSGWCVYLLKDDDGSVRYVGKGRPSRAEGSAKQRGLGYEIAAINLAEADALDLEARLIHQHGPAKLDNRHVPCRADGYRPDERPSPDMTGEELRSFRTRHGLTLEQFGALVEPPIGRADMSKVETGARKIGKVLAVRLRNAMERAAAPAGE